MPRGSKLSRPSTLSATKTSWEDLFTSARYVYFSVTEKSFSAVLTSPSRIVRQNPDLLVLQQEAEADMKVVPFVVVSAAAAELEVEWALAVVEEAVKSTSPTFVTFRFICKLVLGNLLTVISSFPTL